jgi:hypothetical protein
MVQHRPILETLERLKARPGGAPRPVAVYDLDSTLFCTGPRNLAIAHDFAAIRPKILPFVDRLQPETMGWNVMADLEALGFDDKAVLAELRAFWRATFFTDRYVQQDWAYPGAVDLVRAVAAAGCLTYYLTGRDEPGMREGTLKSLAECGFPLPGPDVLLHMKPAWEDEDLAFKLEAFRELHALGEVVLAFENEPANANRFHREFPSATVVLHATIHAPDPEPLDPGVHRVDTLAVQGLGIP